MFILQIIDFEERNLNLILLISKDFPKPRYLKTIKKNFDSIKLHYYLLYDEGLYHEMKLIKLSLILVYYGSYVA